MKGKRADKEEEEIIEMGSHMSETNQDRSETRGYK